MNQVTRILCFAALLLFSSLFTSFTAKAGCGGVCLSTAPYATAGNTQTIHLQQNGSVTLYASYDGCCAALFNTNIVIGWYLNNTLVGTTTSSVTMNNGGYYSSHPFTVTQSGTYTVNFGSAATYTPNAYGTCGSITIVIDDLPSPVAEDVADAPADDLVIKNNTSFFMPGAFTPDGNGVNDLFRPVYSTAPQNYHMQVFDKMGNLVFETRDASQGWDGKVRSGRPANVDIYIWKISHGDNIASTQPMTGKVCVIR